jgi:hypothetical protein
MTSKKKWLNNQSKLQNNIEVQFIFHHSKKQKEKQNKVTCEEIEPSFKHPLQHKQPATQG